jgi:DNA-directed RNA polymerase subunit beta
MTNEGTFLVNGIERIIINQIVRSPGIYYKSESDKQNTRSYTASLISNRGNWVKFEIDKEDLIYVKVDKAKKLSAYVFLLAIGLTNNEIFDRLDNAEYFQ